MKNLMIIAASIMMLACGEDKNEDTSVEETTEEVADTASENEDTGEEETTEEVPEETTESGQ